MGTATSTGKVSRETRVERIQHGELARCRDIPLGHLTHGGKVVFCVGVVDLSRCGKFGPLRLGGGQRT